MTAVASLPSRVELTDNEPRSRPIARFVIAIAIALAIAGVWWLRSPRQLTGTTDIPGYPTFADFNYERMFTAYRLIVYAVPAVAAATYAILAWRGPLRRPARPNRPTIPLTDAIAAASNSPTTSREPLDTITGSPVELFLLALGVAFRVLLPAAVITFEVSSNGRGGLSASALAAGALYVAMVGGLTTAWTTVQDDGWSWSGARRFAAAANGVGGSVAVVLGLWLVSRHTTVHVVSDGRTVRWAWLPLPVVLVAAAAIVGWAAWQRRQRVAAVDIEYRLLSAVVGSVLVFLITASLPGMLGAFQGFDDAQDLAGANLLAHGLFPWRDLTFIHGLFPDVLRGSLGISVFENSRWGELSGNLVIINPLCWVALYLFTVWVARRNALLMAGVGLFVLSGYLGALSWRFVLVPVVMILLGATLRRMSRWWTAALTFVLFAQAVLVPETSYLVATCAVTLILCDVVHRNPGDPWTTTLRRTIWFAVSGIVLVVGFTVFLGANHSVSAFIDYYRVFAPGHDASGAIPPTNVKVELDWVKFGVAIGLVLLTVWWAVARIRTRQSWSSRAWVTIAYAGFVALYAEKPLGRLDTPHIEQFISVALPLAIIWLARILELGDGLVRSWWRAASRQPLVPMARPVTAIGVALALTVVPSFAARVDAIPDRLHAAASNEPTIPRLGYATRNAVNATLLHNVGAVVDTYARGNGPVFDMSNSPGYVYYLLDRVPGTRYYQIGLAVPPYAQNQLVGELRKSRPAVVIFDTTTIGLPAWDGLSNSVRHYIVSQYLLDNWTPVVRTNGVLIMVRNDLLRSEPPLPPLTGPTITQDLYFSAPQPCNWGDIPNFFRPRPAGRSVDLTVPAAVPQRVETITGWAVDPVTSGPVRLVVMIRGSSVVGLARTSLVRPDVAQALGDQARNSGFAATGLIPSGGTSATVLAMTSDGTLRPIGDGPPPTSLPAVIRLPNGSDARVVLNPVRGGIDGVAQKTMRVAALRLPANVNLSAFALATFSTGTTRPIGSAEFSLSDEPSDPHHQIEAHALARGGSTLSIRVGSCAEWHGFTGSTLYLAQAGGSPITDLRLSGVQ